MPSGRSPDQKIASSRYEREQQRMSTPVVQKVFAFGIHTLYFATLCSMFMSILIVWPGGPPQMTVGKRVEPMLNTAELALL